MKFFENQEKLANIVWKTSDAYAYRLNAFDNRDCVQAEYIYLKAFLVMLIAKDTYGSGIKWKLFSAGCWKSIERFNEEFLKRGMADLTWGFNKKNMYDRIGEYTDLINDPAKLNKAFFAHLDRNEVPLEFYNFAGECCYMMYEALTGKKYHDY